MQGQWALGGPSATGRGGRLPHLDIGARQVHFEVRGGGAGFHARDQVWTVSLAVIQDRKISIYHDWLEVCHGEKSINSCDSPSDGLRRDPGRHLACKTFLFTEHALLSAHWSGSDTLPGQAGRPLP